MSRFCTNYAAYMVTVNWRIALSFSN